ncbi:MULTISPECIES: hypothetical protein [Helicobacter]|uniref:Uncharacterized protein n=1 Tax=Helicobacter ibis TaxID=2962633 RepID=A0ABT4VC69_9HELI|nr:MULTISPECIES: hypothetical protein [Helicobacter]MDA3967551.1 hypothetical protein [Helicobacter sp. WB40]MDA3968300.1 hypothetical protein [Helicobacter ibis]
MAIFRWIKWLGYIYILEGKVGLDLAHLLEFCRVDNVDFIDDFNKECISLKEYADIKKDDDILLISSRKNFLPLARTAKDLKLSFKMRTDFVAKMVDDYIANKLEYNRDNTVGIIISGPSDSKHRGQIEEFLRDSGVNLVFICSNEKERKDAKDRIQDSPYFYTYKSDLYSRFTFASVVISEGGEKFHPSVTPV